MPTRRNLLASLAAAALVLPVGAIAASSRRKKKKAPAPPPNEKVLIQITDSDPKRWNLVLTTVKTLQAEYGEDKIDIALVAFGPGVLVFKADSEVANRIKTAVERKVVMVSCRSSMKAINLDEKSLSNNVSVVTSGAAEVIRRQRDGWAYLNL